MTATELLANIFFGYFFTFDDYIFLIMAFALIVVLVVSFLNFVLGIDRRRP